MANTNAALPSQATQQIGASGTYFFKGYITAEEYSINLQGKYGLQVFDVMRKSDATVHAALMVCKNPILGAEWFFEPASKDPRDIEIAAHANYEFFERGVFDHYNTLREGLTFLDMGFFVGELVYDVSDDVKWEGRQYIGLKKIASRKQRSILKFMTDDDKPGVTQILPSGRPDQAGYGGGTTANIPRDKLLYVANDKEGDNYFGVSLLRYAYKPWKIKDGLEIMNAIALENMALGIPYIKKGIDGKPVDENELRQARERLRQQRVNEEAYLEFPASLEIGWMDMNGNSTKDVMPTIEYQDRQILLSVLGQFLLLGANDASGSRAVSQDHSRLYVKSLEQVAKQWATAFQRDVANKWFDINYSNLPNGYPKYTHSSISDEDMTEVANAVTSLMQAGALHADRDSENRLRRLLGMPELAEDDYENYADNITAQKEKADEMQEKMANGQVDSNGNAIPPAENSNPNDPDAKMDDQGLPNNSNQDNQNLTATDVLRQARVAQRKLMLYVGA